MQKMVLRYAQPKVCSRNSIGNSTDTGNVVGVRLPFFCKSGFLKRFGTLYTRKLGVCKIYSDRFTVCGAAGQQQHKHWQQHEWQQCRRRAPAVLLLNRLVSWLVWAWRFLSSGRLDVGEVLLKL